MLWPHRLLPQDIGFFMLAQPQQTELDLYPKLRFDRCDKVLTTIDLFCGAGGLTAGFNLAGFRCLYGNDCNPSAIATFRFNHPETHADSREIEVVDPRSVHQMLHMETGELTVLTGGPPCQGFSINAPERFLDDSRNALLSAE
jgi:DNA (cytosine-5)-methyltransferase 1